MKFSEIDVRDRRLVIIASAEKQEEIVKGIDWRQVGRGAPLAFAAHLLLGNDLVRYTGLGVGSLLKKSRKRLPYPAFDIAIVHDQFRFPVNHPVDGVCYACSDAEPDLYVPLADFHRYMYEAKMVAFHLLCANLGMKTCRVIYAENNGRDITGNVGVSDIPTEVGPVSFQAKAGRKDRSCENTNIHLELPRPKVPPKKTPSGWMNGEPTWQMMEKLRLENSVTRYQAEFEYSTDMGINAEAAAKIANVGLNIGGAYQEMKRQRWEFDVEFWD